MEGQGLDTLQRNALALLFGRKDFTAQDVAELDYLTVVGLPKIGCKGIAIIRCWLRQYGLDLQNVPADQHGQQQRRLDARLRKAERLLRKHGYRIDPP